MGTMKEPAENISMAVDQLGDIRAQKSKLEVKEKELTSYLKKHAEAGTTLHGKFFDASLIASNTRVINAVKAFKKLGKDKFLKIASVTIKNAIKVMSDEDIDAMSDIVTGEPQVRTKALVQIRGLETPDLGGKESIEI